MVINYEYHDNLNPSPLLPCPLWKTAVCTVICKLRRASSPLSIQIIIFMMMITIVMMIMIIIITRPRPAFSRLGLGGSLVW